MSTVFTFPGKTGDTLLQWPVAAAWHKQTGKGFEVWLDQNTGKPLYNLLMAQPGVTDVKLIPGVTSYGCGGQPYHFDLETKDLVGHTVYHMGMRQFPARQITLQCHLDSKVQLNLDGIKWNPCIWTRRESFSNRLVVHGQSVCAHTGTTPSVWKFLSRVREDLAGIFDEVVLVGDKDDLAAGLQSYPDWKTFDDEGDFSLTAELMANSRCVIAAGSSMAALAGAVGVPCIRVHDAIGNYAKTLWSNLGDNQLNATEVELRTSWPEWRDKYLYTTVEST